MDYDHRELGSERDGVEGNERPRLPAGATSSWIGVIPPWIELDLRL
jgi:hypothetical protein